MMEYITEVQRNWLQKVVNDFPRSFTVKIKSKHKDLYDLILDKYDGDTFSEKLYQCLNDDMGTCLECGGKTSYKNFSEGYKKFCSRKCVGQHKKRSTDINKTCKCCGETFKTKSYRDQKFCNNECRLQWQNSDDVKKEHVEKAIKTQQELYGGVGFQSDELKQKAEQTNLERHGSKNYTNREKYSETMEDKYGGIGNASSEIASKIAKSKLDKYGDAYYTNRDKAKKTMIEKYGVEYPMQVEEFKNKAVDTIKEKYGCPSVFLNTKSSTETYYRRIKKRLSENNIQLHFELENYNGVDIGNKYQFECLECDTKFEDHLDNGRIPVCPNCYPNNRSVFEIEVFEYIRGLVHNDIEIITNDRSILDGQELDIVIPKYNIAIELDGILWHSENFGGKNRNYHLQKTNRCASLGYDLIHIFENEWIHRKDIVKSILAYSLNLHSGTRVYARKCYVKHIDPILKNDFLEKNHIQGQDRSSIKLGLFHNEKLLAVMTFSKPRVALGHKNVEDNNWEISRFAVDTDYIVPGAAGKLFKHFVREYKPHKVISYADRRWSTGNLYEQLNFNLVSETPPNYWYINGTNLIHRYAFRKNVLDEKLEDFNPSISEWENMKNHDYDRIWDCGNLKYEFCNKI